MGLIIRLAFRNLFRQKRRNILLGLVIAFSMAALVSATAIGNGMEDIILNHVIVKMYGHLTLISNEIDDKTKLMLRDRETVIEKIKSEFPEIKNIQEKHRLFLRAVGNGKSAHIDLEGIEPNQSFFDTLQIVEGSIDEFTDPENGNAVIINELTAKKLNVGIHDTIKVRTFTVFGQSQTANLTVTALMPGNVNIFQSSAAFIKIDNLKKMLAYQEHEGMLLMIELNDADQTMNVFNQLYDFLKPEKTGLKLNVFGSEEMILVPYRTNESSVRQLSELTSVDYSLMNTTERVLFFPERKRSGPLTYQNMNGQRSVVSDFDSEVYSLSGDLPEIIWINKIAYDRMVYDSYPGASSRLLLKDSGVPDHYLKAVADQYTLFPKTQNGQQDREASKKLEDEKRKGTVIYLKHMYEVGSGVLQYATLLKIVTVVAVIIFFIITQVGIVNTMRMSIRERTREIGTVRSIGMRKSLVLGLFTSEITLLALIASTFGIFLGFGFMKIFDYIYFENTSIVTSLFLLDNHLHFVNHIPTILLYQLVIILVAIISALFTSREAARISVSKALHHYE